MKKLILLSCLVVSHSVNAVTAPKPAPPDTPMPVLVQGGPAIKLFNEREIITLPRQYWYDFYAKFVDLNRTVATLSEANDRQKKETAVLRAQVVQLEKEKESLQTICEAAPKTSNPISGWCYYEPFGWVYQHKDISPWFFINTPHYPHMGHDPNFQMHGWCFLDTSSEDILVYCYFTEKWHSF